MTFRTKAYPRSGRFSIALAIAVVLAFHTAVAPGAEPNPKTVNPPVVDQPFWQEISIPFVPEVHLADAKTRSIRVDRDGRVLVNSAQGLFHVADGRVVPDQSMAALMKRDHLDLDICRGKFVYLTDKFFVPLHGAGADFVHNEGAKLRAFAMTGPGKIVFLTDDGFAEFIGDGKIETFPFTGTKYTAIKGDEKTGQVLVWSENKLGLYEGKGKVKALPVPDQPITDVAFDDGDHWIIGTRQGLFRADASGVAPWSKPIPIESITCVALDPVRGWLWVGTTDGLFRQDADGKNSYYEGKRWLADNHVVDFTFDRSGDLFILTKTGVREFDFAEMTLADKAAIYLTNLRKHHIRFGLVADSQTPGGDYARFQMHDSDNDGLWTSMYLAGEACRLAVTGTEDARENVMDSLDAIERLVTLPTIPGFQARSFEFEGFQVSDRANWRPRPQRDFEWKGTTSSDEIVGTMFVCSVLIDVLGKEYPEIRKRVTGLVDAIMGHIVDHDLFIIDIDNKPTRWGYWNPANINTPIALHDRRLNSIEILAFLQLAFDLTGDEKYKRTYLDLVDNHGYARNSIHYLPDPMGPWNHSDDELYWLSYYVLLAYPIRADLTPTYLQSAAEHFDANTRKRNPVWNTIYAARTHRKVDVDGIAFWLREFPIDRREWHTRNSHRKDIKIDERLFVPPEAVPVLPPDERYVHKWNTNELTLDGGGEGNSAESGAEYLLPYWMARYYGLITAPEPAKN